MHLAQIPPKSPISSYYSLMFQSQLDCPSMLSPYLIALSPRFYTEKASSMLSKNLMILLFIFSNIRVHNQQYILPFTKMRELILLVCLLCYLSFAFAIDPPLLPEHFSQAFLVSDVYTGEFTLGKFWYDIKNNRGRVDIRDNSLFNFYCAFAGLDDEFTSCSLVIMNNSSYIWLQQKNLCCRACTLVLDDCNFLPPRDCLQQLKFAGLATLDGEQFYKWTNDDDYEPPNSVYYASLSQQRIPKRLETNIGVADFIMSSYSQEPINDQVFNLPKQCERQCPGPTRPFSLDSVRYNEKDTKEQRGIFAYLKKALQRNIKLKQQ